MRSLGTTAPAGAAEGVAAVGGVATDSAEVAGGVAFGGGADRATSRSRTPPPFRIATTVAAAAALFGAVFAALAQVFVRKLIHTEATAAIVFYFSATAAALSLLTLPFGWVAPTMPETALLVGAGLLGGVGQILLTESYRHAETAAIAPFDYVSMLLALFFGYWIFAEVPTPSMLAGAALIVAAGLFIIWRERKLGIQRANARKVITPQG